MFTALRLLLTFMMSLYLVLTTYFINSDTATTEIYTLSLHDALPILAETPRRAFVSMYDGVAKLIYEAVVDLGADRKSTRLNSSHTVISYAVFCLKKKMICMLTAIRLLMTFVMILYLLLRSYCMNLHN